LLGADYTALEAQRPGAVEYEWTSSPEYDVGTLAVKHSSIVLDAWLNQSDWYVDPVAGDNENDGTAGTPLATLSEFTRRMRGQIIPIAVTIHMLGDNTDDHVVLDVRVPLGLTIQGIRTVIATGTLTGVVAYNHTPATAAYGTITDTSQNWATLVGERVILTNGANAGAWAWVLKDLGTGQCIVSPWVASSGFAEITPAVSDGYEVVTQSGLTALLAINPVYPLTIMDVEIQDNAALSGIGGAYSQGGSLVFRGCKLMADNSGGSNIGGESGAFLGVTGCLFKPSMFNHSYQTLGCEIDNYGVAYLGATPANFNGHMDNYDYFVVASVVYVPSGSLPLQFVRTCTATFGVPFGVISDGTAAALLLQDHATASFRSGGVVWSLGGTGGVGAEVGGGCSLIWPAGDASTHFSFAGATSDFKVNGVAKTIAALGTTGYVDPSSGARAVPVS